MIHFDVDKKIYGDYHTHTVGSDGENSASEMICAAKEQGLQEVAITDHGPRKIKGLKVKHWARVRAEAERASAENEIKTYFGIESNIVGTDGKIDVPQNELGNLDILLMGVHCVVRPANLKTLFGFFIPNWFWCALRWTPKRRIKKNTEIAKRAIMNNDIDIWTHPNRYFKLNVLEVAKVCAERGTLVELNGKRISFRPIDFERMLAVGAKFIISSDSHSTRQVGHADRVFEFLKYCDYKDGDIINLTGTFKKGSYTAKAADKQKTNETGGENEFHSGNKKRTDKKHGKKNKK